MSEIEPSTPLDTPVGSDVEPQRRRGAADELARAKPGPASTSKILIATACAAVVAGAILVTSILPAEYGIDPLGTGKALGLTALANVRPGVVATQPNAFRRDQISFELAPFESVEYKYRLELGGSMVYSWQATGTVIYDLHSEPDNAPQGYAESFDKAEKTASYGTYTAPFSGIHGWFWENRGRRNVTVTLTAAGFFSGALEFRDGNVFEREILPFQDTFTGKPAVDLPPTTPQDETPTTPA